MIWSGDARRMHAAADGDDSDNDGGDMVLMMMVEGEMEDRSDCLLACQRLGRRCLPRPTTWWAQTLVSGCQAGWAVLLTDIRWPD
jgi:hypothetical protein